VERAHTLPGFGAFILVGSLAGGSPDHMSDVDAIISIDDGAFELAWDSRSALFESPPAVAWDRRTDPEREPGRSLGCRRHARLRGAGACHARGRL